MNAVFIIDCQHNNFDSINYDNLNKDEIIYVLNCAFTAKNKKHIMIILNKVKEMKIRLPGYFYGWAVLDEKIIKFLDQNNLCNHDPGDIIRSLDEACFKGNINVINYLLNKYPFSGCHFEAVLFQKLTYKNFIKSIDCFVNKGYDVHGHRGAVVFNLICSSGGELKKAKYIINKLVKINEDKKLNFFFALYFIIVKNYNAFIHFFSEEYKDELLPFMILNKWSVYND